VAWPASKIARACVRDDLEHPVERQRRVDGEGRLREPVQLAGGLLQGVRLESDLLRLAEQLDEDADLAWSTSAWIGARM
jgi:hypothetical protein